jgi:hypothetical protein
MFAHQRSQILLLAGLVCCCSTAPASQPTPDSLLDSRDDITAHGPLLDAPDLSRWDPQFYRLSEISLSGPWDFAFDPEKKGMKKGLANAAGAGQYEHTITVPYPWQSVLSGVGPPVPNSYSKFGSEKDLQNYAGTVWYSRVVSPPKDWAQSGDWVLRFGAVDWTSTVYIDGEEVGDHVGGYDPFEVIVPKASRGAPFFLAVRVTDPCAGDAIVGGKQGGLWYSCAGGIWQDVTLYRRPASHITRLVEGNSGETDTVTVTVKLAATAAGTLRATYGCPDSQCPPVTTAQEVGAGESSSSISLELPLTGFPKWSPSHPTLLPRTVEFCTAEECDTVYGYGSLRSWSIDWVDGHAPGEVAGPMGQYQGFFVDGAPFYVRGILDQGYHPQGISQYPSRTSRVDELVALQSLGFNTIRQHIKPEPPWFYAACDSLGLAVIYDMPCPYDVAPSPPAAPWAPPWENMTRALIERDVNHPSILFWVNFNEAWGLLTPPFWMAEPGLDYVSSMAQWVRSLDPSRPVEDHSPGGFSEFLDSGALPHVDTDINSFHMYDRSVSKFANRIDDHLAGVFPGSTAQFYGALAQAGQPLLVSEFGGLSADDTRGDSTYALHGQLNILRSRPVIQGFVYTQAYDVEWERNGLWTYSRIAKETGLEDLGIGLIDLLGPNYLTLTDEPAILATVGAPVTLDISAQVVSGGPAEELTWTLLNSENEVVQSAVAPVTYEDESVVAQLALDSVSDAGIYRLWAALVGGGMELARNGAYVVIEPPIAPDYPLDKTTLVASESATCNGGACWCAGSCELSYQLADLPSGYDVVTLNLELSNYDPSEPQTDPLLHGGEITIKVGKETICTFQVPDSPADERGILSHLLTPELRGAYGYAHNCTSAADLLKINNNTISLHSAHGLRVFTPRGGRFLDGSAAVIF